MAMQDGGCPCKQDNENVYEKWLRRRLAYELIRETGEHVAPGFLHVLLHSGTSHNTVASELRQSLWRDCRYPNQTFFQHGQVLYNYPPTVKEILDLRFVANPLRESSYRPETSKPWEPLRAYNLSLREVATVPNWTAPLHISDCPLPHAKEVPLAWTLGTGFQHGLVTNSQCRDPTRVNEPAFPACCKNKSDICRAVYCQHPLPVVIYNPGPLGKGDALIKWHLGSYKDKYKRFC